MQGDRKRCGRPIWPAGYHVQRRAETVAERDQHHILLELFGQDSDDWIGKLIELYVGPLKSQDGGETDGVKVRLPIPPAKSRSAGDDIDDEIPF